MATIRQWLDDAGFDWTVGSIIYQEVDGDTPGWKAPVSAELISADHPILTKAFNSDFDAPECPRFIATDREALYFPSYCDGDGSNRLAKVWKNIETNLDFNEYPTPYPGS